MDQTIQYQRNLSNAYMLIPAQPDQESFRRRMILENQIPHFLPVSLGSGGETAMYRYQISSRVSLEEHLQHSPLRLPVCKQLIYSLCKSLKVLGEYLLTEENLLIRPETIYMEESGRESEGMLYGGRKAEEWEFLFCLYPDEEQEVKTGLKDLLKYLMEKTDPAEKAENSCALLLYELYQRTLKDNFCAAEWLQVMEELPQGKGTENAGESSLAGTLQPGMMRKNVSRKRRESPFAFLSRRM